MKRFELLFLLSVALIALGCAIRKPVTPVALSQEQIDAYYGKGCYANAPPGWMWVMGQQNEFGHPDTFCSDSHLVRQH